MSAFEYEEEEFRAGLYFLTAAGGRIFTGSGAVEAAFDEHVHGVVSGTLGKRYSITL